MKKILCSIVIFLFCLTLLISCAPSSESVTLPGLGETNAAYTMAAILTQAVFQTLEAKLTQVAQTPTPTPSLTQDITSNTENLTQVYTPQTGLNPNAACNWAGFVKDVTIPDNTSLTPRQRFTKTWRLENIGSCSWTRNYSLVYAGGITMSAPNQVPFSQLVEPGQTVDLSIEFEAPSTPGTYISYWMLSDASGNLFGIGSQANGVIWVKIQVVDPSQVNLNLAYSLADNYCSADWFSTSGSLPCPGSVDTTNGSVYLVYDPTIEGGLQRNIPAIIVIPSSANGGYTQGIFPFFQVSRGDHLTTTIGCLDGYTQCDVIFEIRYRTEAGSETLLGSWGQVLDSYNHEVDIPLNSLAGMSVQFILTVYNNGSAADDRAFWLYPAVWHGQ